MTLPIIRAAVNSASLLQYNLLCNLTLNDVSLSHQHKSATYKQFIQERLNKNPSSSGQVINQVVYAVARFCHRRGKKRWECAGGCSTEIWRELLLKHNQIIDFGNMQGTHGLITLLLLKCVAWGRYTHWGDGHVQWFNKGLVGRSNYRYHGSVVDYAYMVYE